MPLPFTTAHSQIPRVSPANWALRQLHGLPACPRSNLTSHLSLIPSVLIVGLALGTLLWLPPVESTPIGPPAIAVGPNG